MRAAQVTATPFPPRKPRQRGKLWPSTAPSPAHRPDRPPRAGKSARHSPKARAVLAMSPASTTAPQPFPSSWARLAMPGFPVPRAAALLPVRARATSSAVRKQPQR